MNLAGRSVNCRYTSRNRAEILKSRTDTTAVLGQAVGLCDSPPRTWINASTCTIYRHDEDCSRTELDAGFAFEYPGLAEALNNIFKGDK
ncbi:hypothetical protein [Arthrobacter sp. AZCC_0090]|uniref:hypothetical protein n=1 Tax=Arthrobacter sp. AZCC_0090 TaxID=2735881 RepID=UPI00160D4245|nr:hypothetical protein [Arthrobacter sp. AZCC_0090]MBB6407068.1 NAD dependent epimerase/dehydratase family enzyme [Arthrobacter sp. AZCC_0090]